MNSKAFQATILALENSIVGKSSNEEILNTFISKYLISNKDNELICFPHSFFGLFKVLINIGKDASDLLFEMQECIKMCVYALENQSYQPIQEEVSNDLKSITAIFLRKYSLDVNIKKSLFLLHLSQTIKELCLFRYGISHVFTFFTNSVIEYSFKSPKIIQV